MKTSTKHVRAVLGVFLAALFVAGSGCTKDSETPTDTEIANPGEGELETGPGIDLQTVPGDNGEIGLMVNTREIARKGYQTAFADIEVAATTGDFSQVDVPVDPFTNIASIRLEIDALTAAQEAELKDGVDLVVTVKDAASEILEVSSFTKTSFTDSPDELIMEGADLEDRTDVIRFRADIPYYIQVLNDEGTEVVQGAVNTDYLSTTSRSESIDLRSVAEIDYAVDTSTAYYFEAIPGKPGVFSMGVRDSNGDRLFAYIRGDASGTLNIQTRENRRINGSETSTTANIGYQFRIEKAGLGIYTISTESPSFAQGTLKRIGGNTRLGINGSDAPAYFRIIALDIDWEVQELETRFTQPILPPTNTDAAFNSTLRNCSAGPLVQTVGQAETLTSTTFTAWEDTFSVSTTDTYSIATTVSAEVEGSYFGVTATVGVETTGSYAFSKSATQTNTRSGGLESSRSVTISTERSITVPPQRATQVSDLYQTYRNIKVPFVQRFRVRGDFQQDGTALSGEEIVTLFNFNNFSGVITEIGSDFIEVTVRGTNTIDRLIDTRTSADNVPPNCGS